MINLNVGLVGADHSITYVGQENVNIFRQVVIFHTVQEQKLNISKKMTSTEASTFPY